MRRALMVTAATVALLMACSSTASAKRYPNFLRVVSQARTLTHNACFSREETILEGQKVVECYQRDAPLCVPNPKTKNTACIMSFFLHNLAPVAYHWQFCLGTAQWERYRLNSALLIPSSYGFVCDAVKYGPAGTQPYPPIQDVAHG